MKPSKSIKNFHFALVAYPTDKQYLENYWSNESEKN